MESEAQITFRSGAACPEGEAALKDYCDYAKPCTGLGLTSSEPKLPWSPLFEALIGTGSGSTALLRDALDGTHAAQIIEIVIDDGLQEKAAVEQPVATPAQSARDQIRLIQASLGLAVARLANVLRVERQTIYNWLQAEQAPALQARTRTRLTQISNIARRWNRLCPLPAGKLAASHEVGGTTLLELLSTAQIDERALRTTMDALADHLKKAREVRRGQLRTKKPPPESADDRIRQSATGIRIDMASPQD